MVYKKPYKIPSWYVHPDKCGSGRRAGSRCAGFSRTKSHPSKVKCGKWVRAVRKCGAKKSSRRKPSPSKSRRRKSPKKSRKRRSCKHGELKNPVTLPSGRKRYCKLAPKRRKSTKKSRKRKSPKKSRKSPKKSRKSPKKSRRRKSPQQSRQEGECVDLSVHGRTLSERRKYSKRPGPPYSAVACGLLRKIGNNGEEYESRRVSRGNGLGTTFRWINISPLDQRSR